MAELDERGLLSLIKPRIHGGDEFDFTAVLEVCGTLSEGCMSTGWVATVCNVHHFVAGLFPGDAQADYFADPAVRSAASFAPSGSATAVDDGWLVTGRWGFGSGVDHARWCFLTAMVADPPDGRPAGPWMTMVPVEDLTIDHASWNVTGLRGTGSKDMVLHDVFVPSHRSVFLPLLFGADGPGRGMYDSSIFDTPARPALIAVLAAPPLGAARAAVEHLTDRMARRRHAMTGARQAEQESARSALATAAAHVDAAWLLLRDVFLRLERYTVDISPEQGSRINRDSSFALQMAMTAADIVQAASGGAGLRETDPTQRIWRDIHAASVHAGVYWPTVSADWGREALEARQE
jgi:3-hydroxy-9,10-secoandrosta-1,3,5(10)-triene-9,17-dione monooxygenase